MRIRQHVTYANLTSSLAVVIALGMGTSYAAAHLPKNSVTTKAIKNNAVKSSKIADGSVTGADLANKGVGNDDLADNSVGTGIIKDGAVGTGDLADGSVTNGKLAAGAVGLGKISADALSDLRLPRAYGVVTANGQLVSARSRGVTVTKIGNTDDGTYCVNPTAASGINPLTTTILTSATDELGGPQASPDGVETTGASTDCPSGFLVDTYDYDGTSFEAEDQAFTFMIP